MSTPYAEFANCRFLWMRPTSGPIDRRVGPGTQAEAVVIEAYLRINSAASTLGGNSRAEGPASSVVPMGQDYRGFITRHAVLPEGAAWLDDGLAWTWDSSGRAPAKLRATTLESQAYLGQLSSLPSTDNGQIGVLTTTLVGSAYGTGGVGELMIAEAGCEIRGQFRLGT